MKEILKQRGFKATPVRLAILDILTKNHNPLNAEMIFSELLKSKDFKQTNEATVYRTLLSFEKVGLIKPIDLRKDSVFFELSADHHHHIVCVKCNAIEDFKEPKLEKILHCIAKKSTKFRNITDHSLELFGVCKHCHCY